MVSRSSRQYIRIFGDASPAEVLALLLFSFRELLSLLTPTFALEEAIVRILPGMGYYLGLLISSGTHAEFV